ncbi:hypothetical protein RB653_005674 [Dictyostelium firmibasis]|uniref:Uncharacterized protein n=1 Tax=Dictyostelium firmibasis TaxID=79012 RepID=A0AAN7U821_9MYCE
MEIKVLGKKKVQSKHANAILGKFIFDRKTNEENRLFLSGNATPTEDLFQIVSNSLNKFQKHLNESINPELALEEYNNNTANSNSDSSDETLIPMGDAQPNLLKDSSNTLQIDDGDVSERYSDSVSSSTNKKLATPPTNKSSAKDIDSSSNSTESESEKPVQKSKKEIESKKSPLKSKKSKKSKKQESSDESSSSDSSSSDSSSSDESSSSDSSSSESDSSEDEKKKKKKKSSTSSSKKSSSKRKVESSDDSDSSEEEKKKKKKKK